MLASRRSRGSALDLYWRPAAGPEPRAGCTTPKFGRSSVERNRLRRRLKELIREVLLARDAPLDYYIRARPPAYELDFAELRAAMTTLAGRIETPPEVTPEAH